MPLPVPLDARAIVAVAIIVLAGFAKGVTGMGLPVAGVPVLVALYGDLRLVLLCTILGTVASDVPMLWRFRANARESRVLAGFALAGLAGIVIGTRLLAYVRPSILAAVLAAVVIAFIGVSWIGRVPTMPGPVAARVGPLVGLVCGVLQGSAGASGPLVTSYLLSIRLPRASFLFAINAIFFVLDLTQFVSLQALRLTTPAIWTTAAIVLVLALAGLAAGLWAQSRIDDARFRRVVLVMLAVAAIGLIVRASRG
jgi:uncharacterized membrane protein YfcA